MRKSIEEIKTDFYVEVVFLHLRNLKCDLKIFFT